ncbi:MAG: hypothetical protein OER88_00760, partial [Planctomycetota bacterium]|nr:hypothetical protein [Planctomycetota bacterium]
MSDQVRQLVALENVLRKARRRRRECEREIGAQGDRTQRYGDLIDRIADEIDGADKGQLQEYLDYLEQSLIPRISGRVETTKEQMVEAATQVVDGKTQLSELRSEYTDTLERCRVVRERLGLDPFKPAEAHFGLGVHKPNATMHEREAHSLVK